MYKQICRVFNLFYTTFGEAYLQYFVFNNQSPKFQSFFFLYLLYVEKQLSVYPKFLMYVFFFELRSSICIMEHVICDYHTYIIFYSIVSYALGNNGLYNCSIAGGVDQASRTPLIERVTPCLCTHIHYQHRDIHVNITKWFLPIIISHHSFMDLNR